LHFLFDTYTSLDDILRRISESTNRVKHVTAFVKEENLILGLVCVIASFLSGAVVLLSMIMLQRWLKQRNERRAVILRAKYENLLSELMSSYYENGKIFSKIQYSEHLDWHDKNRSFNRHILLEQIILLKKHVGGDETEVLDNLYKQLGFQSDSIKKLKSRSWTLRFEGITELTLMESRSIEGTFMKMTKDKHSLVRISAIKALILRGAKWERALLKFDYPLTPWDMYQICEALSKRQVIQLPNFSPLLKSVNLTVIHFTLLMIKHFHSLDAVQNVKPFLNHPNEKIAKAAKDVMEQFGLDQDMLEEDIFNGVLAM
jgi:hypothetical protein